MRVALFSILLFAAFLRFWQLAGVPPSLSHDEVAIGYNAYSILRTGKDEYGTSFPLLFRSFDDYKLPGMVYLTVPSVAIFGLNEWGVRVPSALLGTLSVLFMYFLTCELIRISKLRMDANIFGLIVAGFLAISPWHINFSRQSFESNGAVFFLLLGTFFLLRSLNRKPLLVFAAVFYVISLYFYYSVRIVLPFILLAYLVVCRREVLKSLKVVFLSIVIGFLLLLPILPQIFSSGGFARISTVSVVNDRNYLERKERFTNIIAKDDTIINRAIYNRRVALAITIAENYLKNLSPSHIFLTGTGSAGLLHPFEIPFFFAGFYMLFKLQAKAKWIAIAWLFSVPLIGGLSTDQPNSLRTLPNAPMFALLSGLGFGGTLKIIRGLIPKIAFIGVISLVFIFFFMKFITSYFYTYPQQNSLHFGDGYKQMVSYVTNTESQYDAIYISGYHWRPYIFTLFWKRYEPFLYQEEGTRDHFGKYYFGRASWDREGIFFGDPNIDFEKLSKPHKRVIFILAKPEFEINKDKLVKLDTIDGRFAKEVFVATIAK